MFLEFNASQFSIHRRIQMKFLSSFALTTGALIAAGALIVGTSNVVAEPGGAPPISISAPAFGQDTSTANVSGDWQGSWTDADGNQHPITMQIKQDGSKLSGMFTGQRGSTSLKGSLSGNQVSFSMKGQRQIKFSGTLDRNKMSGTTDRGFAWSATRQ
jgi:hypothetical protein